MTGFITEDDRQFINIYYNALVNDIYKLNKLYTSTSVLCISVENETSVIYKENLGYQLKNKTGKQVYKVLVSTLNSHKYEDKMMISVIGQFVFTDKSQKRFSHHLIVEKKDNLFLIQYETIIFLNEEIVYERIEGKVVLRINKKNKSMKDVVDFLYSYGKIESLSDNDDVFTCKIECYSMEVYDLVNILKENGFEVCE